MVKSGDNNQPNVAPFLIKCYEMVDDPSTDSVISWNQSDDTFVIWNMTEFSRDLLPKFFKHQNFSSFMRQLNIYGFRKVDTDRWEFANEGFIKDQKHLLKVIKRRKHPQGASHKTPHQEQIVRSSDENVDYTKLQKEVEILKIDKSAIMQELSNLRERQESSQNKLLLLRERIQGMESDQQQLLSFLVMVMQNPSLLVQLLQPKENNWRICDSGKITLNNDTEFGDPVFPDGVIVRYQPPSDDTSSPTPTKSPESEKTMEHDLSFDRVKDFFMNIDFPSALDESFLSPENCASLMVPEWDLAMVEQFLLSSPSREGGDDQGQADVEELTDFEMEMEIETALAEKCQLQESVCP